MTYDVAVIGCGPVGALAANLLGREGLRVLVVEQELDPHPLPRAVHLDHEAMRLLQSAGVVARMAPDMRETQGHLHIGADRGVIRYMGTVGRPKPFGWANDYFFYQPEFERRLRTALEAVPSVELRLGSAFEDLSQDQTGVDLRLRTAAGSEAARAKWVIACDGARSAVRQQLGVQLADLDFEEPWLVVDAEVDGPIRFDELTGVPAEADLQQLSVMMCDPRRPATIVPGRGNHRRWEFMLLPGEDDAEMMTPATVSRLLEPWLGGTSHRLIRAATYRFHGLVAETWSLGRVFLAGDAAHQTPPFFGQGMCHGLRDVANLAWKLGLVERGVADPGLLETYQRERDPHVRQVIAAAIEAGRYICVLDPAAAAERDERLRAQQRSAQLQVAGDLIPPICDGLVWDRGPAAGERFVQPWVRAAAGPVLLDDLSSGWRLFVRNQQLADMSRPLAQALPAGLAIDVIAVNGLADDGALTAWLKARGAVAALVRPDFYVFGAAPSADEIEPLLKSLAAGLSGAKVAADLAVSS